MIEKVTLEMSELKKAQYLLLRGGSRILRMLVLLVCKKILDHAHFN